MLRRRLRDVGENAREARRAERSDAERCVTEREEAEPGGDEAEDEEKAPRPSLRLVARARVPAPVSPAQTAG